jgi:cell division septation protein DedD
MDKALKQRLVGATVLILLAVIVLPMLLSGRSDTLQQESRQIEIPDKPDELSIETRRFPVGVTGRPDEPQPQVTTTPEQAPVSGEQAAPERGSGNDLTSAEPPADTTEEPAPAQEAAMESPPAVTTITLAGAGEDNAHSPPPASLEDTPRYLVQVASFSIERNANDLAQELRKKNLPVSMDVVERTAGRLHRVRVGPYARRADADAVVASLRTEMSDLAPRVLDLRPDESAPVTTPSDPLVRWVVQVGSFGAADGADALVAKLRAAGLPAFSEQVSSAAGTAFKVRVGPEISRERAVELMRRLKQDHGIDDSFVMTSE